ncbi:MAG: helix-turn-helix domain-containing protein [Eubacteriales bacterium]|nr:helix-turn-helix domain-containing protein [Eubacteriales bacterium]
MQNFSLLQEKYIQQNYVPSISYYYDRSDMVGTTLNFDHAHKSAEIMYVRHGMLSIKVEDEIVMLGRKQFVWIDAGVAHSNLYFESDTVSMMNVEYHLIPSANIPSLATLYESYAPLQKLYQTPAKYKVFTDHNNSMYLLLKQITQMKTKEEANEYFESILCTQLILILANFWSMGSSAPDNSSYIAFANHYLQEHYSEQIFIKDIANALHIHPHYLQRIYKQNQGCTLSERLKAIRLQQAKILLNNTEKSMATICEKTGIQNNAQPKQ